VLLHGATGSPQGLLQPQLLAALQALGPRAPVVLLPDGGDHSYWHDRRGGRVGSETLAAIARLHFRRVAIGGISMGGYGALLLGRQRHVCAIGAHSPALWRRFADTSPGAFDDAADFRANDVFAARSYAAPVWVDVGRDDGFRPADVAFARRVHAELHVWPGSHNWSYWGAHLRDYLEFYAAACA
jgi:S-formylglutathione hydrolase FrmB